MPQSVKSCSSRQSVCSRSASATSIRTNWTTCKNFSEKYEYACKQLHTQPLKAVKANASRNVLSFVGDRIKYDDWIPILKAIRGDKFLHFVGIRSRLSKGCGIFELSTSRITHPVSVMMESVNCEKQVREFTKEPVLFTKYLLVKLTQALSDCLTQSRALMCLQLQMLPLYGEPIQILCAALEMTRSLQHLSLDSCKIGDDFCEILCRSIRNTTSLLSLDLSNNNLTCRGAAVIADLIKVQEIARYGECWKHSLRYRDVPLELIPGLRRITMNNNPGIGDDGLREITDVLFDDHWIKAIDMQNCGITDLGCSLIIKLLDVDNEIVIFDIRRNPIIDKTAVANIVKNLAINASEEDKAVYGWLEIQSNPSSCESSSSSNSFRSKSASNLGRTKSLTSSRIQPSKTFSTPFVPKILPDKQIFGNTNQNNNSLTSGVNVKKFCSYQEFKIKPKAKPNGGNQPLKAISHSAMTVYGKENQLKKNTESVPGTSGSSQNASEEQKEVCKKEEEKQKDTVKNKTRSKKHSINMIHEKIVNKKVLTQTLEKKTVFSTILSSASSESEIEFNIKERERVTNLHKTLKRFLKSQERRCDSESSDSDTTNYFQRHV